MKKAEIQNITKIFVSKDDRKSEVLALDNISFDLAEGDFVSILGPSGCGKTTLLRIIAGLEKQTSGNIIINGKISNEPGPKKGMVFQEYSLFPWKNVIDNVSFGLKMQGMKKEDAYKKASKYIEMVGLGEFKYSYPNELSGGMKQRVAIARALANEPDIILMDEPFGALDAQTRNKLQNELLNIWKNQKLTVVFVTHSVDEAVYLSDKIIVLSARPGKIVKEIPITIPKPRTRTGNEENEIRDEVLRLLNHEKYLADASQLSGE
ncbi:MAG: ABC transporter ATP-binding protein [Methanosarcinaceae archaeon]|nr:ABC transporter ATP-binding protein [Methanosarcinaceae archaeon]